MNHFSPDTDSNSGGSCINCGQETPDASTKYCGKPDCDTIAALPGMRTPQARVTPEESPIITERIQTLTSGQQYRVVMKVHTEDNPGAYSLQIPIS